ncbi:MAG: Binding-protein-dependent transport systems inner membrane component [Acetothermia bacterium 64_32]|nr:MAG: Binding-protein-dependent transport systems inner membrane component [Acetothermia bacterium 64_32]MBC7099479.1 ABC transporter permease [Candidatus Bipolaricaulota bacterium]HAF70492.1 molybdenum ABC transporter permease [Candidatus Acetothermia bacterium]
MRVKLGSLGVAFSLLGLILVAFIAWPLIKTGISSRPGELWETILDPEVRGAIGLTFYAAAIATGVGLVLGVPLAYILARHRFPGKALIQGLIDLPIVVPHTAAGIALLLVFGRQGFLGRAFEAVGVRFVSSLPGIVVAMLFVSVPFLVNAAREGFSAVDERLERAARTLGAGPWATFFQVALPLAKRGILSGAILMWARGLSEFGAVMILAYHPMTAPVLLYQRFESYGLSYARPLVVWILITTLAVFLALRMVGRRG